MSAEQEMTLAQWVESLPEIHLVRKEYAALLARAEDAEEEAKTLRRHHDRIFAAYEKKQIELSTLRESMRWIPVSERLPTDDMVDIYEVVCKDIHTKRRYDDEVYWQMSFWEVPDSVVIEYWREIQPIPKPPEDSSDE